MHPQRHKILAWRDSDDVVGAKSLHCREGFHWLSPDGRTLWLPYSGLDGGLYTFCAKKATLETRPRLKD